MEFESEMQRGSLHDESIILFLRNAAVLNADKSLSYEKLIQTRWAFGASSHSPITTQFYFGASGRIEGYSHPNESTWSYKNGKLEIYTADDELLWQSDNLYVREGSLHIALKAPRHPGTEFLLYEYTNDGRTGYGLNRAFVASEFLFPRDLQVTPTNVRRVLIVGSCLAETYQQIFQHKYPEIKFDYILMNSASDLPDTPPSSIDQYDFQYLQLPLRTIVTDRIITGGRFNDHEFFSEVLSDGCTIIDAMIDAGLAYNKKHGLLTFIANFVVPQMNVVTSLSERGTLKDISVLVRRLNEHLAASVGRFSNAFICDVDALSSSVGKRYFLDDVTGFYSHGAIFGQDAIDLQPHSRIEPVPPISTFYESKSDEFLNAVFDQALAAYRTVRQIDQVKAVIFDLDNTIWRGQIAEDFRPEQAPWPRGGWQNGIWEAIQHIRARGILVAICSKNDLDIVRSYWENVVQPAFIKLEDFASTKINWKPKPENVLEICREFNLTPKSVVFVDDNPVEREAVRSAVPEIRTFGSNPYLTRRILLWAPEMQVARVTTESAQRETSIRGQIVREQTRAVLSREEFLKSLKCSMKFTIVESGDQPEFARVLELTNKTNQFNTTGKRWTHAEALSFLAEGGRIVAFRVTDKFSEYGLVGAIYVTGQEILQFVMSCRVMGLDVEQAALSQVVSNMGNNESRGNVYAFMKETPSNAPCRDVFVRSGFSEFNHSGGECKCIFKGEKSLQAPEHIEFTVS
jgi:FkbH-like protein